MNKTDLLVIAIVITILSPFIFSNTVFNAYINFNTQHGMITSFIKFGILATFGELLALRLREGVYYKSDFGVLPKFFVWGFLGLTIKIAFIIFAKGVPVFVEYAGLPSATQALAGNNIMLKILVAFSISTAMNIVYAPVMMLFHKITDLHIATYGGKIYALVKPIKMASTIQSIDWNIFWGFVLKKTIPFFWIPAHTITFLLPADFQVLFAAVLSIMLGLILSFATLISKK